MEKKICMTFMKLKAKQKKEATKINLLICDQDKKKFANKYAWLKHLMNKVFYSNFAYKEEHRI